MICGIAQGTQKQTVCVFREIRFIVVFFIEERRCSLKLQLNSIVNVFFDTSKISAPSILGAPQLI
jgi:hypothetical protein